MQLTLTTASGVVLWRDTHIHQWDFGNPEDRITMCDGLHLAIERARDEGTDLEEWER